LFAELHKQIQQASLAELPALIGELEQAKAKAWARLHHPPHSLPVVHPEHPVTDSAMVNIHEAARRLGMSVSWLYRNAHNMPFASKVNGHNWRFSISGIERYLRSRSRGH
jgi:hypothetical protein